MFWRKLRSRWFSNTRPRTIRKPQRRTRLCLEALEARDVPSVTIRAINDYTFPGGKDLFVPLAANDSGMLDVGFSATSSNPDVTATVLTGGTLVSFHVTGTDPDNTPFAGDIVLYLFDDIAPLAVAQITALINSNFYDSKNFHRVIDGFMAQGGSASGTGTGSSGMGTFEDEFDAATTFVSRGLVALANAGDDGNDSQFFITDIDVPLNQMPQHLNFNHSIVGLMVGGLQTYRHLIHVEVEAQSVTNLEMSKPVHPVMITDAAVISNTRFGVLRVSADSTFRGTSTITVTATSTDSSTDDEIFDVMAVLDTVNDPPFVHTLPEQTTTRGTAVTFDVPVTDLENDALTFQVGISTNINIPPTNVTVFINQADHRITLTPNAGVSGPIDLLIGVRQTGGQFDTQRLRLNVTGAIDLDPLSDNGLYNDDNFTADDTPSFTIFATAGQTVTVSVNGTGAFAATESATPGTYTVTLPLGQLQVGTNTIVASVNGQQSLPGLDITYAPSQQNIFVVPGLPGTAQQVAFKLVSSETFLDSEVGWFLVEDSLGRIGTLAPGDDGYALAAINAGHVLLGRDQPVGSGDTLNLLGGQFVAFYLISGRSSADFIAMNPDNSTTVKPFAFFSMAAANPDDTVHAMVVGDASLGQALYGWEDLQQGGDKDYNDMVISLQALGGGDAANQAVHVPAGAGRDVSLVFQLQAAVKSRFSTDTTTTGTALGEVGLFRVDDVSGSIGGLQPGDPGYVQAALNARELLFAQSAAAGTSKTVVLPGGSYIGFYSIIGGTAEQVLADNPSNDPAGGPFAFFSFDAANPDMGANHFRMFSPEQVTQPEPVENQLRVHGMTQLNGTPDNFDDLLFTLSFGAP